MNTKVIIILNILIIFIVIFIIFMSYNNKRVNKINKIIIAHRGASGYLPEHSLASKAYAHALGSDYLEQDIVLTKDNVAIIMHDIEIDTTTNVSEIFKNRAREDGRYYAIDFTLEEIKTLSLKERFDPKTNKAEYDSRFPLQFVDMKIPTLEEELSFIQGLNKSTKKNVGIYPEIKKPEWHKSQGKDISKIVLKILSKYGYNEKDDNMYLQIFDFDELKRIREELNYKGKLIMLIGENSWNESKTDYDYIKTEAGLKEVSKYADGIGPWLTDLISKDKKSELVNLAHKYGMKVHPYTFRIDDLPIEFKNNPNGLLKELFNNLKIDGLFSDFPDLVKNFLV